MKDLKSTIEWHQEEKPINDFQNIRNLKNLADANWPASAIHDLMGQKT
ncbi:hypothetical protein [Pedobacter psychrodurus]|nr:hypothetical protein [Pedobacter psychrodurus]